MGKESVPSLELGGDHLLGLDLVGTVELPSPYPAMGRIFIVRHPVNQGADADPPPYRLFLKIVQKLDGSHVITRFISPEHVKAICFRPLASSVEAAGEPAETLSGDALRKEIESIDWTRSVCDPRSCYEVELRPQKGGVVNVPEAAPVLLRHEQTLPAATSLSAVPAAQLACPPR